MKLIHKQTGKVVREGDTVTDFRGEQGIVLGWTKPHSPASTGRITVDVQGIEHYCYPPVYYCEWIEREDRQEEPSVRTVDATTIEQIALMQKRIEELENTIRELQRILK